MRHIIALFDAPIPATRALEALAEAGFTPADVSVRPSLPGVAWHAAQVSAIALPDDDEAALIAALEGLGVPTADARLYAEGVRRGAILLVVRSPDTSATAAEAAMRSATPPDLAAHQARWAADPGLCYDWAATPPPRVDMPSPPAPAPEVAPNAPVGTEPTAEAGEHVS